MQRVNALAMPARKFHHEENEAKSRKKNNLPNFVPFMMNRSLQVSNQEGAHWTSALPQNSST